MTLAPLPIAFCRECGAPFYRTRVDRDFCKEPCRKEFHERRMKGGLKLYDLAMKWRIERPTGALGDLTFAADLLAQDERDRRRKRDAKVAAHKAVLKKREGRAA